MTHTCHEAYTERTQTGVCVLSAYMKVWQIRTKDQADFSARKKEKEKAEHD